MSTGRRSRLALTGRGVGVAVAAGLLMFVAYWESEPAVLILAGLCIGVLAWGCGWALLPLAPARVASERVFQEHESARALIDASPARGFAEWRQRSWLSADARRRGTLDEHGRGWLSLGRQFRGIWPLMPAQVRERDVFRVVWRQRIAEVDGELVIGPSVTSVSSSSLEADEDPGLARRERATDSVDAMVREWRPGDPRRRVHWRQSAKRGQLMVRQDEPPATEGTLVVIETAAAAGVGGVAEDRLARAACSIIVALATPPETLDVHETGRASLPADVPWSSEEAAVAAFAGFEVPALDARDRTALTAPARRSAHVVALAEALPPPSSLLPGSTMWVVREAATSAPAPTATDPRVAVREWIDGVGPAVSS